MTPDRVDRLVAYLLAHRAEIEAPVYGRLAFDFADGEIKVHLERVSKLPSTAAAPSLVR